MKLSKTVKIMVGLVTGSYLLLPILYIVVSMAAMFSAIVGSNQAEPPPIFFVLMAGMFPLICLVNLLHFGVQIFYIIHIIKNKTGNEIYRILTAIGMFIFPWLAAPIYFFIYIWPDDPPDWALDLTVLDEAVQPPAPVTYPAEEGLDPVFEEELEAEGAEKEEPGDEVTILPNPEEPEEKELPEEPATNEQNEPQEQDPELSSKPDEPGDENAEAGDTTMITSQLESPDEEPSTALDADDPAQTIGPGEVEPPDDATIIGNFPSDEPDKDG